MFLNFFLQPKLKKVNIASTTYLLLSCFSLQAMDNLEEADENVTRKDQIQIFVKKESQDLVSSNIESRVGGIITNFEDIEGDIEKSLQNQTFLLGQTFEEKVKAEEDKKKHLIDETESGIKQKSSSIAAIKGKIIQQTRGISEEIRKISLFIDNGKNGIEVSTALKGRLQNAVSQSISEFTTILGAPSSYHNINYYNGHILIKISEFNNICTLIDSCVAGIRSFHLSLEDVWVKNNIVHENSEKAKVLLYGNTNSVHSILAQYSGDWYDSLKDKVNTADNYSRASSAAADQISLKKEPLRTKGLELESKVADLKIKMLSGRVDNTFIRDYGDTLLNAVFKKSKLEETTVKNNILSNVNKSLDGYFGQGNEYSDKIGSLGKSTNQALGHVSNIETIAVDLDKISNELVDFTKGQTTKISLHHNSLVHKGKEFDEEARNIIEKNREISLGVIKGKTSEVLMAARSLGFMLSDKQDQVETYKEQLKDTGETFKHHEGTLINQHDKHLSDIKGGKKELIEEKDKIFSEKQKTIEKMEEKNRQIENDLKQYHDKVSSLNLQISKLSGESQLVDGTLKGILMMMGVSMNEINDCSGPLLAQKCFSKYLEIRSQK